jgi:hypothetical protein
MSRAVSMPPSMPVSELDPTFTTRRLAWLISNRGDTRQL